MNLVFQDPSIKVCTDLHILAVDKRSLIISIIL